MATRTAQLSGAATPTDAVELLDGYAEVLKILQGVRADSAEAGPGPVKAQKIPELLKKIELTTAVLAYLAERTESKRCENYHERLREGLVRQMDKVEGRLYDLLEAVTPWPEGLLKKWQEEDCTL